MNECCRKAVEEAQAKDRQEIEALAWNLAGCSTFALGYGLDEPWDKAMARPATDDVYKLAMRYRTAKAESYEDAAKIADENECGEYCCSDPTFKVSTKIRARAAELNKYE